MCKDTRGGAFGVRYVGLLLVNLTNLLDIIVILKIG